MVAVGSVRSCGATTLALGLAATWPEARRVVLVEVDPAGGTLGAASGWPAEPSLVSLAAAARRGADPELVFDHCQALPGGTAVLAAPAAPEQSRAALGMAQRLLARLGELDADVIVDCGRLDPGSPALPVVAGASRLLVAVRPRLADLHATATWLAARPLADVPVALVAVGDGPYPDAEIAEALGVEVEARLPWDPDATEALVAVAASTRRLRLAPLVRTARTLAEHLADHCGQQPEAEAAPAPAKAGARLGRRVLTPWHSEPAAVSADASATNGVSR